MRKVDIEAFSATSVKICGSGDTAIELPSTDKNRTKAELNIRNGNYHFCLYFNKDGMTELEVYTNGTFDEDGVLGELIFSARTPKNNGENIVVKKCKSLRIV